MRQISDPLFAHCLSYLVIKPGRNPGGLGKEGAPIAFDHVKRLAAVIKPTVVLYSKFDNTIVSAEHDSPIDPGAVVDYEIMA